MNRRAELDRIVFTREVVRQHADGADMPPDLRSRVAAALDSAAAPARPARRRLGFAIAATLAAIAVLLLLRPWRQPTFPDAADDDYAAVASGELPLELRTADTAQLERWLDARLPFRTRVFDFAMMRYESLGGRVDSLAARPSALFVPRRARRSDRLSNVRGAMKV